MNIYSAEDCAQYSNFRNFTREQLMQLCEMFLMLLHSREITINLQQPAVGVGTIPPTIPAYPYPWPQTWCQNSSTQEETFGSK